MCFNLINLPVKMQTEAQFLGRILDLICPKGSLVDHAVRDLFFGGDVFQIAVRAIVLVEHGNAGVANALVRRRPQIFE